jgi:hypothetical protein
MNDRYLKNPDFWCTLEFADSVKRGLIRHFDTFLHQQIGDCGFASRDPKLFNQDTIAGEAWRLADQVVAETNNSFSDTWEVIVSQEFGDMREWVATELAEQAAAVEKEFLEDELGGLDVLIQTASGTPLGIGGIGMAIDFGMGPGEDD